MLSLGEFILVYASVLVEALACAVPDWFYGRSHSFWAFVLWLYVLHL